MVPITVATEPWRDVERTISTWHCNVFGEIDEWLFAELRQRFVLVEVVKRFLSSFTSSPSISSLTCPTVVVVAVVVVVVVAFSPGMTISSSCSSAVLAS